MITVEETRDEKLIKGVFAHPYIYPYICDDYSPQAQDWLPTLAAGVYYVVPRRNGSVMGMLLGHPLTGTTLQVHIAYLPPYRGPEAVIATKMAVEWVWDQTGFRKILGMIPAYNRTAIAFAKRCGFQVEGKITHAWQHNNIEYDIILLGLHKV